MNITDSVVQCTEIREDAEEGRRGGEEVERKEREREYVCGRKERLQREEEERKAREASEEKEEEEERNAAAGWVRKICWRLLC